ncbi:putative 28S ribosomal protein S26, mitochondrial [Eufriesea mexicana]|uniref:probable 28S ribosomal protein S26, mitochondrial n=1 Tax=Eufriesea mexicana TaxID=516756 RepID=UPI00083C0439|nr:PREDICTED: probable 28S ribosomal protein S26, mitochondrial [Eufriesea mexicana]OAD56544.1 putative 28S ribosomal protein S26, mitochondrial [Eufriesea mexicana]
MIRPVVLFNVDTLTVRKLIGYDHLIYNGPCIQCVRWKRKPIWLPTAKSKMFRVPERKVIPTEEELELKRLHNNYRTLMKSLLNFFIEKEKKRQIDMSESVLKAKALQDFEICSHINENWNKHVAALREQRLAKERKNRKEEIIMKKETKKQRDLEIQEKVDSEIRKAKEEAQTFITSENIDEAISNALANLIDHNSAIDLKGNFYKGEVSPTSDLK